MIHFAKLQKQWRYLKGDSEIVGKSRGETVNSPYLFIGIRGVPCNIIPNGKGSIKTSNPVDNI
jgi:hypothetical protein